MKNRFIKYIAFLGCMAPLAVSAQQNVITPQTGSVKLIGTVRFEEVEKSFSPSILTIAEMPKPGSDFNYRKEVVNRLRLEHKSTKQPIIHKAGIAVNPTVAFTSLGNSPNGTPNDNDIAISNDGKIVSVMNSNMRVFSETGQILKNFTLRILGNIPLAQSSAFDPRVVYDPDADRFIIVFLNDRDADSKTYVCVSKTNDPTGEWYAYALPGANLFQNDTWSDYPIISLTKEDLFITLNMLKNNGGWRDGFIESMIWQVNKNSGYKGDTALKYNKWNGIKYGNRNVWSICPAQGGLSPAGPNAYFLSVRPTDFQNDSIFLHEITNTLNSGTATLSTRLVKASRSYGFPPNAPQPGGQQWLSTNDGRILTAMVQNGIIQFAGNCVDTNYYTAGIFHGYMNVNANTATLNIISADSVDYGYPDIAYAGNGESWDNSAMLTFSKVSKNYNAGTVAMYVNRDFQYSDVIDVKQGTGVINVLTDTLERWGDYTGIQRKYNEPRTFWLAGSLAQSPSHITVLGKITNPDPALSTPEASQSKFDMNIYPNPAIEWFNVEFDLPQSAQLVFNLYDVNGKLVSKLVEVKVKAGTNKFTFNTLPLTNGVYYLNIENGAAIIKNEKVIISR